MNNSVEIISLQNLALSFIPALVVILILWNWELNFKNAAYAVTRMLIQLLLIGYFLGYIFEADNSIIVIAVLAVMLFSSSIIALRTIQIPKRTLYLKSFVAILIAGGLIF